MHALILPCTGAIAVALIIVSLFFFTQSQPSDKEKKNSQMDGVHTASLALLGGSCALAAIVLFLHHRHTKHLPRAAPTYKSQEPPPEYNPEEDMS